MFFPTRYPTDPKILHRIFCSSSIANLKPTHLSRAVLYGPHDICVWDPQTTQPHNFSISHMVIPRYGCRWYFYVYTRHVYDYTTYWSVCGRCDWLFWCLTNTCCCCRKYCPYLHEEWGPSNISAILKILNWENARSSENFLLLPQHDKRLLYSKQKTILHIFFV